VSDYSTIPGGGHGGGGHHHHYGASQEQLTPTQRAAALAALQKLTGSPNATWPTAQPLQARDASGLVSGHGDDTFAGGVHLASSTLAGFATDTVVGGSTASAGAMHQHASGVFLLGNDTVHIAGPTAAAIKALDHFQQPHLAHTITLSDNTSLHITGVHPNDLVKPHN